MEKNSEVDLSFGFERALLLMREGKKVQQVGHEGYFYWIEDNKLCQSGPLNNTTGLLTVLNASEIIVSRWIQV